MESFTDDEKKVLSRFCTSTEKDVFALINLPQTVCGALFSRYSRSSKSLRRVLLDEFINKPESGFSEIVAHSESQGESQIVAIKKAEDFYDRVLVGYGDDSVAELGGAHIACENISNVATKFLQDARIGISPLEKSTRYVYFNQKDEKGNYRFLLEPKIMESRFAEEYVSVCNLLFDTYSSLMPQVEKAVIDKNPKGADVTDRAYSSTIRAKTCDILRGILPASTLTNTGMYGNGRAFEYLITKGYASPLSEINSIAKEMDFELKKVIPVFVKRASEKYGLIQQEYFRETEKGAREKVLELGLSGKDDAGVGFGSGAQDSRPKTQDSVVLVDYDKDAEDKIVSAIIFARTNAGLDEIKEKVKAMDEGTKHSLIDTYVGERKNRRHKPGRAFENAYCTFSLLGNFGMYRDLHRHRILTQERQLITTKHGFDMPSELVEMGLDGKVKEAIGKAGEVFEKIQPLMPLEAQYAVPLGFRMRWYMKMNLREAMHFMELRSMVQGHKDYRKMAQEMYLKVKEVQPYLASHMKFVDFSESALERLEAEKKIDRKLEEIEKRR